MQISNITTGAVNAPTTPQHSTQSMLSTQQNASRQGFEATPGATASPRLPNVDAQTAAELAAAATRAPNTLGSLANAAARREAYNAGLSSRSGSPMVYDQLVPVMDDPASGAAQEGITFRPIAVRSKTEAAHTPGGWRFGDGSSSPAWGSGGGGNTPFQPAAFSSRHTATHVKAEQQQGHAVPAHSANGGDAGCSTARDTAGQSKNRRSLSRAVSGQLAPEPSLRDALLERSGDSNALAGAEPDLLSPLPHDNHAELPLEARDADGIEAADHGRGIPRVSSWSTLTRCVCHNTVEFSAPIMTKTGLPHAH